MNLDQEQNGCMTGHKQRKSCTSGIQGEQGGEGDQSDKDMSTEMIKSAMKANSNFLKESGKEWTREKRLKERDR